MQTVTSKAPYMSKAELDKLVATAQVRDGYEHTLSLHIYAATPGAEDVVGALLAAYPEGAKTHDKFHRLPLHCATFFARAPQMENAMLLAQAYPPTADWGMADLIYAGCLGEACLVRKLSRNPRLAEKMIDLDNYEHAQYPLHLALAFGTPCDGSVQALLKACPRVASSLGGAHPVYPLGHALEACLKARRRDQDLPLQAQTLMQLLSAAPEVVREWSTPLTFDQMQNGEVENRPLLSSALVARLPESVLLAIHNAYPEAANLDPNPGSGCRSTPDAMQAHAKHHCAPDNICKALGPSQTALEKHAELESVRTQLSTVREALKALSPEEFAYAVDGHDWIKQEKLNR